MAGLRFPPRLTPTTWENVLLSRRAPLAADGRWTPRIQEQGLHLDFSRVEFADMSALARGLLLVDAAVRDSVPVRVTLPTAELPDAHEPVDIESKEQSRAAAQRLLTRRARGRGDARDFMRQVGFLDALVPARWPEGTVRLDDAATVEHLAHADDTLGPKPAAPDESPYVRRRILPFHWLPPLDAQALVVSQDFQGIVARLRDLGLSQPDADALSQTVLMELLTNVAEHAAAGVGGRPPHSLVGAVFLDSATYGRRYTDMPPASSELAELAAISRSEVLRLLVGDSGSGLVTRLDPVQARRGVPSGVRPVSGQRLTEAEDTVFYAFGHSSEAPESYGARGAHHGLWRVRHLVKSYGGSVVVRTADALAGLVYTESDSQFAIAESGLSRAPGTLHEVQVLTDPKSHRNPLSWVDRPEAATGRQLRWVRCMFDPVGGLGATGRANLLSAAREAARDPSVGGVVLSMSLRDTDHLSRSGLQSALTSALGVAGTLADLTAVAVLFPDADPKILDLSVTGLHAEHHSGAAVLSSPILVHGCYGSPIWYGGSIPLRAVLRELSRNGGVMAVEAAMRRWTAAGGEPGAELWRMLDRCPGLVDVSGGQVSLVLSPHGVLRTLQREVQSQLAEVVEEGGEDEGVARGLFRTPGLRITRRWVDSAKMLTATIGTATAAYVLARKVEQVLAGRGKGEPPTMVAHVSAAPRLLAARLSESLALGGRHHAMPGELDLEGLNPSERVQAGERVVLITDLLSTENTTRRAAAAVAAAGAEPAVIACVVDARPERRDIQLLNRSIPVVSLTDVSIDIYAVDGRTPPSTDAGLDVVDIDPILRHPVVPSPPEPPRISEIDFLRLCTGAPDTLSLGHLAGPRSHSSAMLHLDRALRHPETGAKITDILLEVLREAVATVQEVPGPAGRRPLQLWYAGTPDNSYDSRLPVAVHRRLRELDHEVGQLVAVPRGVARNQWIFPTAVRHESVGQTVVVLDGRTTTGTTLQQMIRLAAASGAAAVVAVVLLDRLEHQEAAALRMLQAVVPTGGGGPVPTVVRFVSASSIPGEPPHDCAICATRMRVQDDTAAPDRLRRHAAQLRELLRPRRREEVFSSAAADLFAVPIISDDVIDYIRWRALLRQALRDTGSRQRVVDQLRALLDDTAPGEEFSRVNLLRLLAAEQQWLKLPPLRFTVGRDLLARLCVAGLGKSANVSPWLRVQALMVLAATTPQQLTEVLPRLLALALDEPLLVDQMFLECYRLLQRPPHDSPIDLSRLRESLLRCRKSLEEQRTSDSPGLADEHLHVVQQLITIADHKARPKPDDPQKAWEHLREDLGHAVMRHRLDSGLLRVRDYVEDLEDAAPSQRATQDARSDWETCKRHLAERALVCLPVLRHILAGEYVDDQFGRREHERLMRLLSSGISALSEVTERLDRLLRGPRRVDDLDWQLTRNELLDRLDWWYRMFLATHLPETGKRALVVDLVSSAPTMLEPVLGTLQSAPVSDIHVALPASATETEVFCPAPLLHDAIDHVLDNARRHRVPGAECRLEVIRMNETSGTARVRLRTSGTRPSSSPGQGLRTLDAKLRPFGASLTGQAIHDDGEWTFETLLTLRLWEGA